MKCGAPAQRRRGSTISASDSQPPCSPGTASSSRPARPRSTGRCGAGRFASSPQPFCRCSLRCRASSFPPASSEPGCISSWRFGRYASSRRSPSWSSFPPSFSDPSSPLLPLRQYFTSPEFGGFFLNIAGLVHFTLPGVFEHNPDPRFIASQLWTIPFEFECYIALAILSVIEPFARSARLCADRRPICSLAATICALLISPVSPFDHVPGLVLILCFLAAVSLYLYRDTIPYSPRLALGAASHPRSSWKSPTPPISPLFPSPI